MARQDKLHITEEQRKGLSKEAYALLLKTEAIIERSTKLENAVAADLKEHRKTKRSQRTK